MADEAAGPQQSRLLGYADRIDWDGAAGWAFDPDRPETPVELEIVDNGEVIARISADRLREGLAEAGIGNGRHSFEFQFRAPLANIRHLIRIRGAGGGPELTDSGVVLEPVDRDPADAISVYIDHPVAEGGQAELTGHGNLFIEGWAIAECGVERIEIMLDGVPIGAATHGLPRKGVHDAFPERPNSLLSGFAFSMPGRPVEGAHRVAVVIHDKSGFSRSAEFALDVLPRTQEPAAWLPRRHVAHTELSLKLAALAAAGWQPDFLLVLHLPDPETATIVSARRTVQSLRQQAYPHWRLALAGPESAARSREALVAGCDDLAARMTTSTGAAETGSASLFIVPMRAGDELGADALLEFALAGLGRPNPDFLYGDERRADPASGIIGPYFKPDWSPDLLLSTNYIGRVWAASAALFARTDLRPDEIADAEYDAVLRLTEAAAAIGHVQKVLCGRGPAPPEPEAGERRALIAAIARRGIKGAVLPGCLPGFHRVKRAVAAPGKVSIVMPTAGARGLFRTAIESLRRVTQYPDLEIVAVDNIPAENAADRRWLAGNADRVVRIEKPFNWSHFSNAGAAAASGDFLLFLNDDVEMIEPDWLDALVEHAQRPEVAVVGAQLLYPDRTVQHAGMFLSLTGGRHPFRFLRHDAPGTFGLALTQREVIAVTGACMLVRRDHFTALGGFDEDQGVINNDLDFCLRAHEAGLRTIYTPYASLIHHEKASRAALDETEDETRFRKRWAALLATGDPYFSPHLSKGHEDYQPDPEPVEILFPPLPLAPREAVQRIAVLKLDHIGDFVTALPALHRLKARFPQAELVVVAPPASEALAALEPAIDRIIPFDRLDTRAEPNEAECEAASAALADLLYPLRVDLAIDLRRQPETRPLLRQLGANWLAGFDTGGQFPWLDIAVSWGGDTARAAKQRHVGEDLLALVDGIAAAFETRPPLRSLQRHEAREVLASLPVLRDAFAGWIDHRIAAIHPGAGAAIKQWPAERFAALIDLLAAEDGMRCLLIGSREDSGLAEAILEKVATTEAARSLAGRVPLADLPLALQGCDLLVGNNSGPQHLAAALGIATVNVHSGVIDPHEWGPIGPHAVTVRRAVSCSPCYLTDADRCHRGVACLEMLAPVEVLRACRTALGGIGRSEREGSGRNRRTARKR